MTEEIRDRDGSLIEPGELPAEYLHPPHDPSCEFGWIPAGESSVRRCPVCRPTRTPPR